MHRRSFLRASAAAAAGLAAVTGETSAWNTNADMAPVDAITQRLNPKIQRDREIGLDILKPSKRDLEHGLRLHAESIVFDGYSFSPRAAVDGDALAAAISGQTHQHSQEHSRWEGAQRRHLRHRRC